MRQFLAWMSMLFIAVWILGCAAPVGVSRADEPAIYRQMSANALSTGRPSSYSMQFLERLSMADEFARHPEAALAALHGGLGGPDGQNRLFALAELSFLHARERRDPQYFLASAVYAHVLLFPEDRAARLNPFDPRLRLAMDLYNRALTDGLRDPRDRGIDLTTRSLTLPFGSIALSPAPMASGYDGFRLTDFSSTGDYKIRGLRNHYRKPGIGAALMGRAVPLAGHRVSRWFRPRAKVPVTAFLRLEDPSLLLKGRQVNGRLELYDADVTPALPMDGLSVPLESDPSVALAYGLHDSPLWDFEIAGFRRGDFNPFGERSEGVLSFIQPHRPGRIPVVFVHGTASSPARWAEIVNELQGDSRIASRFQFWFYIYNSGNPIALSAIHLRESLQTALQDLDPQGRDPALRRMVVIGHSQGGLLAKMTSVSSGSRFWDNISREPFAQAKLSRETRDLLRRGLFVEPLPFVRRLVFIATPHRGSYMAENRLGMIARRFVNLPAALSKAGMELISLNPAEAARAAWHIPTSIENMDWSNPFLRTLCGLPLAPGVEAHSIIAVKGRGPVETGVDGVVRYASAHIADAESELVVRSGHSCQSDPHTIEEVRRILYEHDANVPGLSKAQ